MNNIIFIKKTIIHVRQKNYFLVNKNTPVKVFQIRIGKIV